MSDSVSDEAFANYLNHIGVVTLEKIEAARSTQAKAARRGAQLSLADALVQAGAISSEQRENIQKKFRSELAGGVQQLGQFRLLKKVGEGGMGAVYLAEDTLAQRKVALKILPRKYAEDAEYLSRFRREARAMGKLSHVNIVGAHTVGEEGGSHFYVMEYCEGESLDKVLKRQRCLPWDKALEVVTQVTRGLKHAHAHGVIHRDVKPANIIICKPPSAAGSQPAADPQADGLFDEGFVAKILDLGLSKTIGGPEQSFTTLTGVVLGTAHYISPEQARGDKQLDGRSDIYSLGATFYHLLTGQTPFQGSSAAVIITKHLLEQLPNPQDLVPDVPDEVVQILQKMMGKEPVDRYADCQELLDDLELAKEGRQPSSPALDAVRSTISVPRSPRAGPAGRYRKGAAVPPASARVVADKPRDAGRRKPKTVVTGVAAGARIGAVPLVEVRSRKPWYIAAGVLALLLLVLAAVLVGRWTKETATPLKGQEPKAKTQQSVVPVGPKIQNIKPKIETAPPKGVTLDLGGGVKMEFVLLQAGEFEMGSRDNDPEAKPEEKPAHRVRISKPFYMARNETTAAQFRVFADAAKFVSEAEKCGKGFTWKEQRWQELAGVNWRTPGFSQEDNHPACVITWNDAQEFCKWAAKKAGRSVALPSEAQWEFACRASTTARYNTGDKGTDLEQAAWFLKNSGMHTNACGQRKPNAWGLYDMHGNVWEWVQDCFSDRYYADSPPLDPKGPASGGERALRGGGWDGNPDNCRAANRGRCPPGYRATNLGFRVVLVGLP